MELVADVKRQMYESLNGPKGTSKLGKRHGLICLGFSGILFLFEICCLGVIGFGVAVGAVMHEALQKSHFRGVRGCSKGHFGRLISFYSAQEDMGVLTSTVYSNDVCTIVLLRSCCLLHFASVE